MELHAETQTTAGYVWPVVGSSKFPVTVAVASVALYLIWRRHPRYGGNPALPSFPIVGCLPLILLNRHRFYEWSCELFERAHSLTLHVFLGLQVIIATADPQNVRHILKSRFDFYPKGPNFYPYFDDMFGRGIFNSDGRLWRFQRKVASHIFTSNSLRDFVVDIAGFEICHRLVPALNSACEEESGRPIDLQALFMDFTFDTSSQLTFGADPAALIGCVFWNHGMRGDRTLVKSKIRCKSNSDCAPAEVHPDSRRDSSHLVMEVPHDLIRGFAQGFPVALEVIANRFLLPTFLWKLQRFLNIGSERKLREALKVVNEFAAYVIEKSKVESSGRRDLLARFMQLSKAEVSRLLDDDDEAVWRICSSDKNDQVLSESLLKDILLSFILAGRDTVASALSFFVWQICLHPEVEKRIYEEVQVIIRDRQLKQSDSEGAGIFSYEEIRKMNYLHAAFSESMRLSPPVPSNPKYAAEDDTLPDGTKICKGYAVSYNVFALCRAQQIWGNDSLEFKPERWLDQNGQFVTADPFKYPVFQAGPRTCLGKDFAYIQVKLVVACLVRDYVFSLSPGFKPNLSFGVNLNMTNGLPVTVRRRE